MRVALIAVFALLLAGTFWFLGRGGDPGAGRSAKGEPTEATGEEADPFDVGARRLPVASGDANPAAPGELSAESAEPLPDRPAAAAARLGLRVFDAQTRMDLLDVIAVTGTDWTTRDFPHPGEFAEEDVVARGDSPLEIRLGEARRGRSRGPLWVGAPGYAWERLDVDFATSAERLVELERGAALEVTLEGDLSILAGPRDGEGSARLRLLSGGLAADLEQRVQETVKNWRQMPDERLPEGRRPTEREIRDQLKSSLERLGRAARGTTEVDVPAPRDGEARLEGLAPGRYEVAVERGALYRDPRVLGRTAVELEAGITSQAILSIEAPGRPEEVQLAGTLFLPPEWQLPSLWLRFDPLDVRGGDLRRDIPLSRMTPVPDVPGLYRWDAGEVAPGRVLVTTEDALQFQEVLDTGPSGRRDAEIVIGLPADVSLRVLDADRATVLRPEIVAWSGGRPEGITGLAANRARWADWNPEQQAFEFRAPAGEVKISVYDRNFEQIDSERAVRVNPGANELTLKVRRACGVVLNLKDGDDTLPWGVVGRWPIEVSSLDRDGRRTGSGDAGGDGLYLQVSVPGRYAVSIPTIPGYEPVPVFLVDIRAGEFVEREVALRRKR